MLQEEKEDGHRRRKQTVLVGKVMRKVEAFCL